MERSEKDHNLRKRWGGEPLQNPSERWKKKGILPRGKPRMYFETSPKKGALPSLKKGSRRRGKSAELFKET